MSRLSERRNYYRETIEKWATCNVVFLPDGEGSLERSQEYRIFVRDLSGGGALIETSFSLPVGTRIFLNLPFLGLSVLGEVIHCPCEQNFGIQFLGLTEKIEQRIISFVFREQQKRRQIEKYRALTVV